MIEVIVLGVLTLIWIISATIQDFRTKEIANWLSFSLIIFALGFRFFYSLFSGTGFGFFYQGLIGLGIFFVLGNLFYHGRMFAGGDAKLMISLGAILPFSAIFFENLKIFAGFFILFLLAGSVYGIGTGISLTVRNSKKFKAEFLRRFRKNKNKIIIVNIAGLGLMLLGFVNFVFILLGMFVFISPYLFVYAKALDESSMIKKINVKDLREGDWIYKDVKVGSKTIKSSWDGINKTDISLIRKKYKIILIRQGVPFTPVFLISFLILFYLYLFNPELLMFNFFFS